MRALYCDDMTDVLFLFIVKLKVGMRRHQWRPWEYSHSSNQPGWWSTCSPYWQVAFRLINSQFLFKKSTFVCFIILVPLCFSKLITWFFALLLESQTATQSSINLCYRGNILSLLNCYFFLMSSPVSKSYSSKKCVYS